MEKYKTTTMRVPALSISDIEREIDDLKTTPTATEKWMSARANNKMYDLDHKDRKLRDAFETGYRMGSDDNFIAPLAGFLIAMFIIAFAKLAISIFS